MSASIPRAHKSSKDDAECPRGVLDDAKKRDVDEEVLVELVAAVRLSRDQAEAGAPQVR